MARKNKLKINLSEIENFQRVLRNSVNLIKPRLQSVMSSWGRETQGEYDSRTGYGSGLRGKRSFYSVEEHSGDNVLRVSVGHNSFVARFLEVGTKPHSIVHGQGSKVVIAKVRGIKGTRALFKTFSNKRLQISRRLKDEINNILIGG